MEESANRLISCKLTAPELQKRKSTIITQLRALVVGREKLSDGYSYSFEGGDQNLDTLIDFIKTERECCDFFTFQLKVAGNTLELTITGPDRAKHFLKEEIDL